MRTILLIDDDEADAFIAKRAFETAANEISLDLKVTRRVDGVDGIEALKGGELPADLPDTIVVDLNMPRMDGLAFLRWLRRESEFKGLHAVVLTTALEFTIHAAALSAGADRVFAKPNSLSEMDKTAREILYGSM